MLVLTRKPNECIYIGDIKICYVQFVGGKKREIRLGIEAPKHIPILRGELVDKPTDVTTETKEEETR